MPSELLTKSGTTSPPPERIKNLPQKPDIDVDATPKKQRFTNPNNWHPKIMAAIKRPLQTASSPTFTKIMNFCRKNAYSILPKGYPVRAPNAFFGTCFFNEKWTKSTPRPRMHMSNLSWPCWRTSQKTPSKLMQVSNRKITTYLTRVIIYVTMDATISWTNAKYGDGTPIRSMPPYCTLF